jgi:hypothetical protein
MRRLPFLGGKEFDFFRTYKMVRANGGMLKVQENRQFKAIANTFDFPPTCTNGGHQMRAHYVKFLYPYERVKEYNLPDDLTIDVSLDVYFFFFFFLINFFSPLGDGAACQG